jgi:hypothetical protein
MISKDFLLGLTLLIISSIGFYSFSDLKSTRGIGPSFFPHLLLSCLLLGAMYLMAKEIWLSVKKKHSTIKPIDFDGKTTLSVIIFWISTIGYVFLFIKTNMIISTCIFLFVAQFIYGRKKYLSNSILAVMISVATYYLLTLVFQVPL